VRTKIIDDWTDLSWSIWWCEDNTEKRDLGERFHEL